MTSLDDLRATFEDHAAQAGDGLGMVQAARAGAVRLRRRRRITTALVAATAVLTVAVTVPVTVRLRSEGTPAAPAPPRETHRMTAYLDPRSGFDVTQLTGRTDYQQISAGVNQVTVYEPGVYDPTTLLRGEKITVSGHEAWYLPPGTPVTEPDGSRVFLPEVVGWRLTSGAWVVVSQTVASPPRATLESLAAAVRFGPPRDLVAPIRLPALPQGWHVTEVLERNELSGAIIEVAGPGRGPMSGGLRFLVYSALESPFNPPEPGDNEIPLTVAGRPAWINSEGGESAEVRVSAGSCVYSVVGAKKLLDRQALIRIAEGVQVADCDDRTTWASPLP